MRKGYFIYIAHFGELVQKNLIKCNKNKEMVKLAEIVFQNGQRDDVQHSRTIRIFIFNIVDNSFVPIGFVCKHGLKYVDTSDKGFSSSEGKSSCQHTQ